MVHYCLLYCRSISLAWTNAPTYYGIFTLRIHNILYTRPLALPTNIKLGWKDLPETNALAYYRKFANYDCKKFCNIEKEFGSFLPVE